MKTTRASYPLESKGFDSAAMMHDQRNQSLVLIRLVPSDHVNREVSVLVLAQSFYSICIVFEFLGQLLFLLSRDENDDERYNLCEKIRVPCRGHDKNPEVCK